MTEIGPLVGEPLALDLVNTRARLPAGSIDFLTTVAGLKHWLDCERDRLATLPSRAINSPTARDLRAVRAVRDHAASAIERARHGARPPARDLRGLNEVMGTAPLISDLAWSDGALRKVSRRTGPRDALVAAELAEAVATLLADPSVTTIRQCEADFCVLLFRPAHPRRRWCSPTICGNRVRVARFHERFRAAR
jgi:predicted RNA-binding Zn ribbon-like protein